MLRHDVGVQRCRVVTNLDLQIADRVTGVEWAEQGDECIDNGLAARQFGKVQIELFSRRSEIEEAILRERRRQRIGIAMVKTESVAMHRIRDFIPIRSEERRVGKEGRTP